MRISNLRWWIDDRSAGMKRNPANKAWVIKQGYQGGRCAEPGGIARGRGAADDRAGSHCRDPVERCELGEGAPLGEAEQHRRGHEQRSSLDNAIERRGEDRR